MKRAPRLTRRQRRGPVLVQLLHEDHCKCPALPCTCTPEVRVIENVSREAYVTSAREQADRLARIQRGLS